MANSIAVTIRTSRWLRDTLFAASALLRAVELADPALITDDVLERAGELREALELGPIAPPETGR